MKKNGVTLSLPSYLSASNVFPACIINAKGQVVTANNLFKQVCGANETGEFFLHTILADNNIAVVLKMLPPPADLPLAKIQSKINGFDICWEIAPFGRGKFICTGNINSGAGNAGVLIDESHFSAFFDNGPALMWATDREGRIRMMNKRYKQHTGFTDKDAGRSIWDVFPKKLADQFKKNDDIVLESNDLLVIEEISVDKAGVKKQYLVYKFPLQTDENGVMVAGCSIDITAIIEKTKQLDFQSHLLDSIEQAVYVLDADKKVIYWNRHAEKMYGWLKEEIMHRHVSILNAEDAWHADVAIAVPGKGGRDGEIELRRKDGTLIPVYITKSPVFDDENNITGFIGISKDISEHKIVHKKLVKQNNQFRQIARLQSHAVRRPLANMLGLIDLIQHYYEKKDYEEVMYMITLLKESSEDLDDIIRRIVLKTGIYFDPALKIT